MAALSTTRCSTDAHAVSTRSTVLPDYMICQLQCILHILQYRVQVLLSLVCVSRPDYLEISYIE